MNLVKKITRRVSFLLEDNGDIVRALIGYSTTNGYTTSPLVGLFALRVLIDELERKTNPLDEVDLRLIIEVLEDYAESQEAGELDTALRYAPSAVHEQAEMIRALKQQFEDGEKKVEEFDFDIEKDN